MRGSPVAMLLGRKGYRVLVVDRTAGTAVPNYFRRPFGHGWALVGDAGHNKDPITAQGITDAFLDEEHCASASLLLNQIDYARRRG